MNRRPLHIGWTPASCPVSLNRKALNRRALNRYLFVTSLFLLPSLGSAAPELSPLNEVIIHASRTDQSPSLWPGSAYALDDDELGIIKHRHIAESLVRVPGVWISRGNGQEHLTAIRSPVLSGAGACGAFLMAEDNIPLRAAGFCNVNQLFEATSELAGAIEVLSGPQSVLYGANAMHGVINVVSSAPDQSRGSTLSLEAGSYDYYRATFLQNGGTNQHDWSLGFNGVGNGGDKHSSGFDQQKLQLRHRTLRNINQGDLSITTTAAFTNLNQETAGFIGGDDAYLDDGRQKENPNPEAYRDASSQRVNVNFEYRQSETTRWILTPYLRNNDMEFLMHFLPWQPVEKNNHSSAGWQAACHHQFNDAWAIHGGLDGEYTQGKLEETQIDSFSPSIPAGVHYDYQVDAQVISPFTLLQWQASSALSLSVGLRYEWLSYDYENNASSASASANGPCAVAADCRFANPDDRADHFNNASWQLGAIYEFSPWLSIFSTVSRAYRAPQTTELYRLQDGQLSADLEAETLDSIEIGVRGNTRNWRYSLASYHMEKDDVIFQDSNRWNISGASTKHAGLDLALTWSSDNKWYASINASYARHTYDSDMAISDVDIKGNEIDTAPRYMGSVQVGKATQSAGKAELEWVYMGSYYTDPENEHSYRGHRLLNLRWQWQASPDWQLGLRINNMLDEDYADRADFGFGLDRYFVGEPRTGFIELTRRL